MNMTITPQIASFAEAVRDALYDLPDEERDELTGGLEADLAEEYAEGHARDLPDPVEYATELRDAAGLPKGELAKDGTIAALVVSRRPRSVVGGDVVRKQWSFRHSRGHVGGPCDLRRDQRAVGSWSVGIPRAGGAGAGGEHFCHGCDPVAVLGRLVGE
jgi:hypothetical protein